MTDLVVLGALFLDQEFRFMGSVERDGTGIVELAFQEEQRGKDLFLAPGGSASNTAIQAARLGMKTEILGKLGNDPFATLILQGLEAEGVDTKGVLKADRERTGVTMILSGKRGGELDLAMVTYNGANETFEGSDLEPYLEKERDRKKGGVFFVGDFFSLPRMQPSLANLLAGARKAGRITALDHGRFLRSNTADRVLKNLQIALEWVDIYLPSEREIKEFTKRKDLGDALRDILENYGVTWIAVKRGSKGCRLRSLNEDFEVPSFPVRGAGVSALGAGSAFNAAFLWQWQQDPNDPVQAARAANAAGRIKIISGQQPTKKRLMSFLEKEARRQARL